MQGRSVAFNGVVLDPADHVERTAWLLEQLAAEVRSFGVIDGSLIREREYAPGGDDPTGVQIISVNMRIDHNQAR